MAACSGNAAQAEPSVTIPPAPVTDSSTSPNSQTPEPTPLSLGAAMLEKLPKCDGIQVLDQPIKFDWPNIDERLQELADAQWGYYSCPQPQPIVAAFYREQMPKPPVNMYETNWVERTEGSVGVYYNGSSTIWTYLWVISQPRGAQKSYVIVAQSLDPVQGECKLDLPLFISDIVEWEIQWSLE
jgi:hypothetical protein